MIGPFPPPIHGMSMANKMLFEGLSESYDVVRIDSNTEAKLGNFAHQGTLKASKIVKSLIQVVRGVLRILVSGKFDVVYITPSQTENGFLKYVPFIFAANMKRLPCLIHIHGGFIRNMVNSSRGLKRRIILKSLRKVGGAIVLGPSLRYMFEGLIPEARILVCPNGVEDEIFASRKDIGKKVCSWKKDSAIRILYLSNVMRTKGFLDLVEAVKILREEGREVYLDVTGSIEPEIQQEFDRYLKCLENSITYHGVVSGEFKKELFLKNYIFCLPSYYPNEGQPISILEAMANGCRIVVTDHAGIKDIVSPEYGAFVGKQDPIDLARALKEPIEESMIWKSWERSKEGFSAKSFVGRISQILAESIDRKTSTGRREEESDR